MTVKTIPKFMRSQSSLMDLRDMIHFGRNPPLKRKTRSKIILSDSEISSDIQADEIELVDTSME